jgi:hypothetical protein
MLKVKAHPSQSPHAQLQTVGQQEYHTYPANQLHLTQIMQARIGYTWYMIAEWSCANDGIPKQKAQPHVFTFGSAWA